MSYDKRGKSVARVGTAPSATVLQVFAAREPRINLVATVTETLRREIIEGRLQPGDRLPTEAALGASAGVSRTVVREAVASLKAEGLVETRQGAGAFVLAAPKRLPAAGEIEAATVEDIVGVLELRLAVEVEVAALAASRRDEADLKALEGAMSEFAAQRRKGGDTIRSDLKFHRALAAATKNAYFASFLDYLGEFALPRRHLPDRIRSGALAAEHLDLAEREHRAICDAVRAKDSAMAAVTMRLHLGGSRSRYMALVNKSTNGAANVRQSAAKSGRASGGRARRDLGS
jgi:GntR family transcriptional regulator, transcriptional repressor for pyruvate dehydrogenase complex